ncbi:peritrophin-55-like [Cochliomyia hominivorax]
MHNVFIIATIILAIAHHVVAVKCPNTPVYNAKIDETSLCKGNDINFLWPNYENVTQYYRCQGEANPILEQCPISYSIFDFVQQKCSRCERYIPTPECKVLETKAKIKCTKFTPSTPTEVCDKKDAYKDYKQKLDIACVGSQMYTLWPNYANVNSYIMCKGLYNPISYSCPPEIPFFNFYQQECTSCSKFMPALECSSILPKDAKNLKCVDKK